VAKQALGSLTKSFRVPTSPDTNCVTSYANGPDQFERKGNRPNAASFVLFRERVDAIDARWQASRTLGPEFYGDSAVVLDEAPELERIRALAARGMPAAQAALGHRLMAGAGVPRDRREGIRWIREAASQDSSYAQFLLGSSYARGDGVERDPAQAELWLRRAADQGDLLAHFQLATVYYEQRRFTEAVRSLRHAADRELPRAQVMLATMYRLGQGVPVDLEESTRLLTRAANRGSADAQNNLGMAYLTGDGVAAPDPGKAAVWFERAARQGQVNAQFSLAMLHVRGQGVPVDEALGLAWLEIAAERGFQQAIQAREQLRGNVPEELGVRASELADRLAAELQLASSTDR
jgi:TPR repeat protein